MVHSLNIVHIVHIYLNKAKDGIEELRRHIVDIKHQNVSHILYDRVTQILFMKKIL